jgi:hypothetical protein
MSKKKNGENSRGILCQFMTVLLVLDSYRQKYEIFRIARKPAHLKHDEPQSALLDIKIVIIQS